MREGTERGALMGLREFVTSEKGVYGRRKGWELGLSPWDVLKWGGKDVGVGRWRKG